MNRYIALDVPAFLLDDPLRHVDMLEPLRNGHARVVRRLPDGILIHEAQSGVYMLAAANGQAAATLLEGQEAPALAVSHGDADLRALQAAWPLRVDMTCHQAAYWAQALPEAIPPLPLAVRPLPMEDLAAACALYSHDIGGDYLAGRIAQGALLGAYDGPTLAAFAGLHEEGSMGMLEVAPAYRRRGIARALLLCLMDGQLRRGRVPFSQMVAGNEASLALHRRLGFAISGAHLCWLFRA